MVTLIAIYSSYGREGRCDAGCYNATSANCTCVCGGRNHGVGYDQAAKNTREMAEEMVEEYAARKGLYGYQVIVPDQVRQLPLFKETT